MKKMLFAAIVTMILVSSCTYANNPATTPPTLTPDVNGFYTVTTKGMTFMWKITGSNIECKLTCPAHGWIAAGFDSAGKMNGQNIVIGYVVSPGTVTLKHKYGSGHGHNDNTTQDLTAITGIEASESSGTTEIDWTMPLTPSEGYGLVQGAAMYLTLAYGSSSDNLSSMHSAYGRVRIILQ